LTLSPLDPLNYRYLRDAGASYDEVKTFQKAWSKVHLASISFGKQGPSDPSIFAEELLKELGKDDADVSRIEAATRSLRQMRLSKTNSAAAAELSRTGHGSSKSRDSSALVALTKASNVTDRVGYLLALLFERKESVPGALIDPSAANVMQQPELGTYEGILALRRYGPISLSLKVTQRHSTPHIQTVLLTPIFSYSHILMPPRDHTTITHTHTHSLTHVLYPRSFSPLLLLLLLQGDQGLQV
jgi:hypothetical protein